MSPSFGRSQRGFTLLEILVATGLFAIAIFAIIKSGSGSIRSVRESQMLFKAVQIGQTKMQELEEKYQKQIDRDGVKDTPMAEEVGAFEAPFELYSWEVKLIPSTMKLNESSMRGLLKSFGLEDEDINAQMEDPAQRLVLGNINKALKENFVELILLVKWERFGRKSSMPIITHLIPTKPKITLTQNPDDFEKGDESAAAAASPDAAADAAAAGNAGKP